MAATVSLSKGVFAFKRLKPREKTENAVLGSNFWRKEEGRDDPIIQKITYENYYSCWSAVEKSIEKFLDETYAKVFEDLINYIRRVGILMCDSLDNVSNNDIPTACLVTGVNMPDHATLFNSLTKSIRERISPYVARLCTSDCTSIKVAMSKLILSLMNEDEVEMSFESDTETDDDIFMKTKSPTKRNIKKSQCSLSALASWYKETEMSEGANNISQIKSIKLLKKTHERKEKTFSPKKRFKAVHIQETYDGNGEIPSSSGVCGTRPVVVIVEEVESTPVHVLQDLILMASVYRWSIPFVFVFGVSTTSSYLHRHLSHEASSHVAMETFQAQPSSVLFSQLIEKVLMKKDHPFHVGGKVFKLLLDIFLFHDLSINNFISNLRFCMLEHFLRGETSFLCCTKNERERHMHNLNPKAISALRDLPSYEKFEKNLSVEKKEEMEEDSFFCKSVLTNLKDLETYYSTFCCLVKVLHCIVHSLPGSLLGRQVRELFSTCLSQHVTETEDFQSAWKYLSMTAKEELSSKVQSAIEILSDEKENIVAEDLLEKLRGFSERLIDIEKKPSCTHRETKSATPLIDLKPGDRFYLREKLLGVQKSKTAKNPYEELRIEILACFEHIFIVHLKPPFTKPFHEVFFFDSIANVKYQLLGSVRATITTGLVNPQKYFQCACCHLEENDSFVTSLPDLSLCYKLHLECGRLINLYDWMQAFVAVINGEEASSNNQRPKNKKMSIDEQLQARFIQSVSELQLLGFIKPTKKKTDHVERITWGGC